MTKIHPAGDIIIDDKLVIEPLGFNGYLYNLDGNKGIVSAIPKREISEGKKTGKILYWYIEINSCEYIFDGKPLSGKLPFCVPNEQAIQEYITDVYPVKNGKHLYLNLLSYLRTVIDFPKEKFYMIPAVVILQSWLKNMLNSVFYIGFDGRYGNGKTVASEVTAMPSYHGYFVGDMRQAGVSRLNDRYRLSLFLDEIDALTEGKDNEVYTIFRKGYRRNSVYIRINPNTFREEILDIFGVKGFTFHGEIEPALRTRSLICPMMRTPDKRLPIIDTYKEQLGKPLQEDFFFWYMDNAIRVLPLLLHLPYLPTVSMQETDGANTEHETESKSGKRSKSGKDNLMRQDLYEQITKDFSEEEKAFLWLFTGRNVELAFNIVQISKAFGIDLTKELEETFLEKEEDELFNDENETVKAVKGILENIFNEHSHKEEFHLKSGEFKDSFYFSKSDALAKLQNKTKLEGNYLIRPATFSKCLKEIGFQETVNIKRQYFQGKNVKCLIYDDVILCSLGINTRTESEELIK